MSLNFSINYQNVSKRLSDTYPNELKGYLCSYFAQKTENIYEQLKVRFNKMVKKLKNALKFLNKLPKCK